MLQHAQQYVDAHLREREEQVWLRHLVFVQVIYESLEREKQSVSHSLRQAQLQEESAERARQHAQTVADVTMVELFQARDDVHMWENNPRVQYSNVHKVSEAHQDLYH